MRFYTCDPNVELNGNSTQALIQSVLVGDYQHILEEYGLDQIDPAAWYSLQTILNVLQEIAQAGNSMMDFVSIGMAAAELSQLPPQAEELTLEAFFEFYAQLYPTRHRNGDAGYMQVEITAGKLITIMLDVPYPDDLMYGMMYGFTRRLAPASMGYVVAYDDTVTRKDQGGDYTVIRINLS